MDRQEDPRGPAGPRATDAAPGRTQAVLDLAGSSRSPQGRWRTLVSLPPGRRWPYFRQELLARLLVAVTALAVIGFLLAHLISPPPGPRLYLAAFDRALGPEDGQTFQDEAAKSLGMPSGHRDGLVVDTGFIMAEDGLNKLQTMLNSQAVDLIVAPADTFALLAGFGYLSPLPASRTADFQGAVASYPGFDDGDYQDMDYDGSGKGPLAPYGVAYHIDAAAGDGRQGAPGQGAAGRVLVGIVGNTRHRHTAETFLTGAGHLPGWRLDGGTSDKGTDTERRRGVGQ